LPSDIAIVLTRLTTHNGQLPQGAPTSSYLANLALWEREPDIVTYFSAKGIRYSRYIDDITLSSTSYQGSRSKSEIIRNVRAMCDKNNYTVKRSKHRVESSGKPMRINNLQINKGITLPKKVRARIRAAVQSCEIQATRNRSTEEYRILFNSTLGRVNHLRHFHRQESSGLLKRLDACKPICNSAA